MTDPCPHEQRKRDGCHRCDDEAHDKYLAERDAAKFRARVIQTARALLPHYVGQEIHAAKNQMTADQYAARSALKFAEAFERAADTYLKDGGGK